MIDIGYLIVMPALLHLDSTSIIMAKNVTNAFQMDFHVCLYITCEGYGFAPQGLWQEFSWAQKLKYYWSKLVLDHFYYISWFRRFLNKLSLFLSALHIKKAQTLMKRKIN